MAERPTGFRLALQRQHVSEALTLQRDLREALARLLPEPPAGTPLDLNLTLTLPLPARHAAGPNPNPDPNPSPNPDHNPSPNQRRYVWVDILCASQRTCCRA